MKNQKAFTIVELMIVVAMIAIVIMLVAMNYQKTRGGARDRIRVAHVQELRLALQEYQAKCGEYPPTLNPEESSSDCPPGFTLADVLPMLPENPNYTEEPLYYQEVLGVENSYNGYYYSGLSTGINGKCYEYHLGVVLESGLSDDVEEGRFLQEDHDCPVVTVLTEPYDHLCGGSGPDFGEGESDTTYQMYDFRSANNC